MWRAPVYIAPGTAPLPISGRSQAPGIELGSCLAGTDLRAPEPKVLPLSPSHVISGTHHGTSPKGIVTLAGQLGSAEQQHGLIRIAVGPTWNIDRLCMW